MSFSITRKFRICLNLHSTGTLDMSKPGNLQGDEQVALNWKKYLERRDDVDFVHLVAQSRFPEVQYDVVVHFNPFFEPHPKAKNIMYLQNAFPPDQFEGGTVGVFNSNRNKFVGYMFTSEVLKNACADGVVVPFATDPEQFYPQFAPQYTHPVSIVGNDIRGPLVNDRYFSPALPFGLAIYSKTGWAGALAAAWRGGLPQEDLARLYSSTTINLNAHLTDHIQWQTINLRIFDILACGGFVLSDDMPVLRETFGDTIGYTDGYEDEWAKLVYYLNNNDLRYRSANEGREIVLASHTYSHRVSTIMKYFEEAL